MAADFEEDISPEMESYREYIDSFTVVQLQAIRECLGFDFRNGNKAALVSALLRFFSGLEDEERFQDWFQSLPPYLSRAIEETTFRGHIHAEEVEALAGQPAVLLDNQMSYYRPGRINPGLRLGIFYLYQRYDRMLLFLDPIFRKLMAAFLPVPAEYTIRPANGPDDRSGSPSGWSAEETLSEPMPILLKSIRDLLANWKTREKILRKGLNKSQIKALRKSSMFPSFPSGGTEGPDPIELITRFIAIDPEQLAVVDKKDVRDFIKGLITTFFTIPPSRRVKSDYLRIDSGFEFQGLCPHLRKGVGPRLDRYFFDHHPSARIIIHQVLKIMARSPDWYTADSVSESIRMQALTFSIFADIENAMALVVKGDALVLPDGAIQAQYTTEGFSLDMYLYHTILTKPLVNGYLYLMASLGIVEIEEVEPDRILIRKGVAFPISPFDGLHRVRVTPFGAWCLNVSREKPELNQVQYEAIADRELPLITYRGQSVECKVYLERIGTPIGADRFRISEASFIRNSRSLKEIEQRISDFHRLIAHDPAPHWEALFARIRDRARLFDHQESCIMIRLPEDQALRRLFLEEKKISSLVVRAEGGRIVVTNSDYTRLRKILEEYGVLRG